MTVTENIFFYLRLLTFIVFLYASILLYPGLIQNKMGIICLIFIILYSIVTFLMFFIKNKEEEFNIFNNLVACLLHLYFLFITFKYMSTIGFIVVDSNFFSLNYFIISLSMFILTFNKFVLYLNK